jgi:hypothetical protein
MKKQKQKLEFPFGQILAPEHDRVGNYIVGRTQLCVGQEMIQRLSAHSAGVDWSAWKKGPRVCTKGRRNTQQEVLRITKMNYGGWRASHWDRDRRRRLLLGYVLGDLPLLFPTAEDAVVAAELFTTGSDSDLDLPFAWLNCSCGFGPGASTLG